MDTEMPLLGEAFPTSITLERALIVVGAQVTLERIFHRKRFSTAFHGAHKWPFVGVRTHVGNEVAQFGADLRTHRAG